MKVSAGLLMFRGGVADLEVLLCHPGGPFFKNKSEGVWTIPKGLVEDGEDLLATARREFAEETSLDTPDDGYLELGSIRQKGGKQVHAWAFRGDCDPAAIESNPFTLEWPPRSGREQEFPEVDEARFATPEQAARLMIAAQLPLLERLIQAIEGSAQSR